MVEASLTGMEEDEKLREEVMFVNGKRVAFPRWFLDRDDNKIKAQFLKVFPQPRLSDEKLLQSYATVNLIPQDLLTLLKTIQATDRP